MWPGFKSWEQVYCVVSNNIFYIYKKQGDSKQKVAFCLNGGLLLSCVCVCVYMHASVGVYVCVSLFLSSSLFAFKNRFWLFVCI